MYIVLKQVLVWFGVEPESDNWNCSASESKVETYYTARVCYSEGPGAGAA